MPNSKNSNLHMVRTDWDEIEQKIRRHRRKRTVIIIIIVCICAAAAVLYFAYTRHKSYDDFAVTQEYERAATSAAHYLAYADGYLKYSNDGASYVSFKNTVFWNQSYEIENPIVSVCHSYAAVADRQGETVYVMDEDGLAGEISVSMPVFRIDVASQGTVAVLMEDNGTGYLALFDKTGNQIAEGAVHVENSGIPMDIALSADGKNLAVSIVDVSSGKARTTINFYNFSTAGQNQIDNLVAQFTYEDTVIPDMTYVSDSMMLAFGDNAVYTFAGASSPAQSASVEADEEIQSIFYDDSYFALVFSDTSKDAGRVIKVYDTGCREQVTVRTEFSYDSIGFLDNHEICMYNSARCSIFTLNGLLKFTYEFEDGISAVFHDGGYRGYVILKEGVTDRVRLRLIDRLTGDEQG